MFCVIFHNMIIENEEDQNLEPWFDGENVANLRKGLNFETYMESTQELKNFQFHCNMRMDLVEHSWPKKAHEIKLCIASILVCEFLHIVVFLYVSIFFPMALVFCELSTMVRIQKCLCFFFVGFSDG